MTVGFGHGAEEMQIPVASGLEQVERRVQTVGNVTLNPDVLIKGLDECMWLIRRAGESLAEAKGEDKFTVGKMSDDLADTPLGRSGPLIDLLFGERCGEASKAFRGSEEDWNRVVAA
jgi:hypothetical protein